MPDLHGPPGLGSLPGSQAGVDALNAGRDRGERLRPAPHNGHPHHFRNPAVKVLERIVLQYAGIHVMLGDLSHVIAAEAENHLGKVVCA